jgi:hypothetical protein
MEFILSSSIKKANPYKDPSTGRFTTGGAGLGNQGSEYPTAETNHELLPHLRDYIIQYPDGFGHESINGRLRNRGDVLYSNLTPKAQNEFDEAVGSLDRLVELSPALPETTKTYRGIDNNFAMGLEEKGIGSTYTDNGFTSVSLDRDIAGGFPSRPTGNIMEIVIPQGVKVINPSKFFSSSVVRGTEVKREKELILGRGTNFEILSIVDSPYGVGKLFKVGIKQ